MSGIKEVLTKHAGKSISFGTLAVALVIAQAIIQYGDTRWCLADDADQVENTIEQHIETELEDNIMIINMKQAGSTQAQIDAALKSKYEARLKALRDQD
jgi:hypothetical protein